MGTNSGTSGEPRKGWNQVERSQTEPWGPTQPYLNDILGQGEANYQEGVGGLGQGTLDTIAGLREQGTGPSGQFLEGVLSQQGTNPYLSELLNTGSQNIADQVRASYSAKGRYGSEDFTDALTRGISNFQTPILYQAYGDDQSRRMQAAEELNQQNMGLFDRLLQAGQLEDYGQQAPFNNYANLVTGIAGLGGTQNIQEPRRPLAKLAGGLLTGLGAFGGIV